jgi:hypothetical protein
MHVLIVNYFHCLTLFPKIHRPPQSSPGFGSLGPRLPKLESFINLGKLLAPCYTFNWKIIMSQNHTWFLL